VADVRITSSDHVAPDSRASPPPRLLALETEQCYDVSTGVRALGPRTRSEASLNCVHARAKSLQTVTGAARVSAEIEEGGTARTRERTSGRGATAGGAGGRKDVMGSTRCFSLARMARNVQDAPVASAGMTWDDSGGGTAARESCVHRRKQRKAHLVRCL
jgi:hypothetical protein